jgi:hypothetical protein
MFMKIYNNTFLGKRGNLELEIKISDRFWRKMLEPCTDLIQHFSSSSLL